MRNQDNFFSTAKITKPTQPFSTTNKPFLEQSNSLSLKFQDLRSLMKKKEAQYQNQLMIQDAERVHNFLSEVQEKHKESQQKNKKSSKKRMKREVMKYNSAIVKQFQRQWFQKFSKTVEELQQIENMLQSQQAQQQQKALNNIQDAKNGKDLQKLKYSKRTLEMEDQLRRLVKSQRYEEAYVVSSRWQKAKKEELHNFISRSVSHSKREFQKLKKKHDRQRQIFADRLTSLYLKEKRRHDLQYQKLLKNTKTYQVDLNKIQSKISRTQRSRIQKSRQGSMSNGLSAYPSVMGIPKQASPTLKDYSKNPKQFQSPEVNEEKREHQNNEEKAEQNQQKESF